MGHPAKEARAQSGVQLDVKFGIAKDVEATQLAQQQTQE